jgi:hypothetical protein
VDSSFAITTQKLMTPVRQTQDGMVRVVADWLVYAVLACAVRCLYASYYGVQKSDQGKLAQTRPIRASDTRWVGLR